MNAAAAIQAAIGLDVTGMQKGGAEVEKEAEKMRHVLEQIGVGLSFGAVMEFFKSVTEQAGKVQDLSERLEVGTDALQAFTYHAKLAGVDGEAASTMWDKARKSIDQLVVGQKAATDSFAALHLKQEDLMGLPLEVQVEKIAKAYQAAKGEAGAYDAITDVLGSKTAPRLMAVIDQLGTQGLPAFTQAARDAGQVMEGETIAKLDEFGDRLETLKGAAMTAGSVLAGTFIKLGEGLGYAAANIANSFDGIQTNWDISAEHAKKAADASEKAAGKMATHLAKTAELGRLEDAQFKKLVASLEPRQQILKLQERALELRVAASNAGKGSEEAVKKETEAVQLFAEALRVQNQEKEKANKIALDQEQESFEWAKAHREQLELEAKLKTGIITPQEQLHLDILRLQSKELEVQIGLQYLLAKPLAQWTQQDKELFGSLQRQSGELGNQIKLKQGIIEKGGVEAQIERAVSAEIHYGTAQLKSYVEEWTGWKASVSSVGRGDKELSDKELDRKEQNIKQDIFQRTVSQQSTGWYDGFLEQQKYNLAQVQAEERLRSDVRSSASSFGADQAFSQFSGLTEQRFKQILQGADTSTQGRIADELDKLNKRLTAGVETVVKGDGS